MWIFGNDFALSIVKKDCAPDELMVRARRKGDIELIFPKAKVTRYTKSDYLYRAAVKIDEVKAAHCREIDRIVYSNFKNSVRDNKLHDAYARVWSIMASLQEVRPYSGGMSMLGDGFDFNEHLSEPKAPKKKQDAQVRKNLKKLTRGQ